MNHTGKLAVGEFLFLILSACAEAPEPIIPEEGNWNLIHEEILETTCPFDNSGDITTLVLSYVENGFIFTDVDGSVYENCVLKTDAFKCDESMVDDETAGNAFIELWVFLEGQFDSETSGSGEAQLRFECEGSDCEQIELPCMAKELFNLQMEEQ